MRFLITALLLFLVLLFPVAAEEYDLDIEIDIGSLELPPAEEEQAGNDAADDDGAGAYAPAGDAAEEDGAGEEGAADYPAAMFSREESALHFYGYLVNYSALNFYPAGEDPRMDLGNVLYVRIKGDAEPEEFLQFHTEFSYSGTTGNQNFYALMDSFGMIPVGSEMEAEKNPYEDFVQDLTVDHLWGSVSLGLLDLQFGKIPLAWGTGYVFNPTARAAGSAFMDTVAEETPGTLAVSAGIQLPRYYSLQGYTAFQDKFHISGASLEDGEFDNLPWGLKLTGVAGSFDFSLGMLKEVIRAGEGDYLRAYYGTTDFAGALGPFGVYGEAALALPGDNSFSLDFQGWTPLDRLEAVAGFDYEAEGLELTLRGEYYHNGPGTADPDEYDNNLVLSGAASVLGKDYLFLHLERLFIDYLTLSAGVLTNLNDFSTILFPEASYEFASNFTVSAGGFLFISGGGGEFGGEYGPEPADLTTSAVFVRMKLSF